MLQKHFGKIFIIVAVVCIAGAYLYSQRATTDANQGVEIQENVKGNPESPVVLRKYSDFQCPACAQFSLVVNDIMDEYSDFVRFEYKHFPLITIHPNAVLAARAAEAAGQQGKFFEMHDKLFENQTAWSPSRTPQTFFNQYAEEIGLDVELYKTHMKASLLEDKVMDEFQEARDLGLTGTPTFFLNGERMQFDTYQEFADQIADAVAVAYGDGTQEEGETEEVPEEEGEESGDISVGDVEFNFSAN